MTPERAIANLPDLLTRLDHLRTALAREVASIEAQWRQLGRVGGQRSDHAAALLGSMAPHLQELEIFTHNCLEVIQFMQTSPFAEEVA